MQSLLQGIQRFMREEDGVTMIEYALIAALISVVAVTAIKAVGTDLNALFTTISSNMNAAV